jgi:AcrR family transcriptional regulator
MVPLMRPRVVGAREAEILDAAVRVLADVGYDRLTMDHVAAEAHASKATLYRRWSSKAQLVVDAASRAKGLTVVEPPRTGSLRGDLLALFCGPGGVTQELPMSVLAGLMTALHTDPEFSAAWRERVLEPRLALVRNIFAAAVERGEVDPRLDVTLLSTVLPSMCSFHSTVLGRHIDIDFVARIVDQVVLRAAVPTPTHDTSRNGRDSS